MAAVQTSFERRLELLAGLPGLDGRDPALPALAAALEELRLVSGELVFQEGERGDALFVIADGLAELTAEGRWTTVTLTVLGPGEMVGETSLVFPERRRNATLAAKTELVLLRLGADAFTRLVAANERLRPAFEHYADELLTSAFIQKVGPFAGLDNSQARALAPRVRRVSVEPGELIVRRGEAGDSCFIVRSGSVEVLRAGDGSAAGADITLHPGEMFGEACLFMGERRTASVRARESCELFELDASDLAETVTAAPTVAAEITFLFRLRSRPRRADGIIEVESTGDDRTAVTTLKNRHRLSYFRLSPEAKFVWDRLDGTRTVRDLTMECADEFGPAPPDVVAKLVLALARAGMLAPDSVGRRPAAWEQRRPLFWRLTRSAKQLMCRLYDSRNVDPLFTRLYRGGGWLLGTRPALALLALIAVGGLVSFGYGILSGARGLERHPELASLVVPGLFGALVVHELSHGLAVKSYGHSIPSAGVGLWWLRPVAFVDTSEMWFSPRRERIMVSLAGPFSGLVLMGLLATASLLVDDLFWSTALWSLTLPVLAGVIMNLAPFLELDGYHVLCDLVDRPNLKRDALAWTAAWLRGERHTSAAGHRLYVGYTVASLLYMLLVLAGLVLVLRPIMARWLAGLLPDTVASPVAWALCGAQFLVVVGAVIEEYGAILRLIRRRTRQ